MAGWTQVTEEGGNTDVQLQTCFDLLEKAAGDAHSHLTPDVLKARLAPTLDGTEEKMVEIYLHSDDDTDDPDGSIAVLLDRTVKRVGRRQTRDQWCITVGADFEYYANDVGRVYDIIKNLLKKMVGRTFAVVWEDDQEVQEGVAIDDLLIHARNDKDVDHGEVRKEHAYAHYAKFLGSEAFINRQTFTFP